MAGCTSPAARQELSAPQVADLHAWMREQRARLARGHDLVEAMDYMLKPIYPA
jgi:hypothetical protein